MANKSRLHYLLDAINMNRTEFAAELSIDTKRLEGFEQGKQIYDTAAIISNYFRKRNNKADIMNIRSLISSSHDNLSSATDNDVFYNLQLFLCKEIYVHNTLDKKKWICKGELYSSFCQSYSGLDQSMIGFSDFLKRACILSKLEKTVVLCNRYILTKLSLYDDVKSLLRDASKKIPNDSFTALEHSQEDSEVIIMASIKNHFAFCLYKAYSCSDLLAILFFDNRKANNYFYNIMQNIQSNLNHNSEPFPKTRFAVLLDYLGIDNSTLSKAIFVDNTLVSKWRTSKRRLGARTLLPGKLINYLFFADNAKSVIQPLMKAYYLNAYRDDEYLIKFLLSNWLSYNDSFLRYAFEDKTINIVEEPVFIGHDGFIKALTVVLQYCRDKGSARVFHAVCFDSSELYFLLGSDISRLYKPKLTFCFRADFKISQLAKYMLGRAFDYCVGNIIFEKILKGDIIPFIYYDFSYNDDLKLIVAVKDTIALEVVSDRRAKDSINTIIHFNKSIINRLYKLAAAKRAAAKKVAVDFTGENFNNDNGSCVFISSDSIHPFPLTDYKNIYAKHIIISDNSDIIKQQHNQSNYVIRYASKEDTPFWINYILDYNNSYLIIWNNIGDSKLIRDICIINLFYGIFINQWDMLSSKNIVSAINFLLLEN